MAANSILPNNTKLTGYTYVSFGSSPTGTTYSVLDIGLASIWQYRPTYKLVWGLGMP